VDMDLVRDIDKDVLKQALMKAFYEFSVATNMKIIAEGIETMNELETLIHIGIPYGQGYLLQRPAAEFLEMSPAIKNSIVMKNQQKKQETFHTPLTMPIGGLCRHDQGFAETMTCSEVMNYFTDHPNVMGITILQGEHPVGLVMKDKFLTSLATQYGVAVYMNRPISLLMEKHFLIVDYNTPLEQVSSLAITRNEDTLYDYIVITQQGQTDGFYKKRLIWRLIELNIAIL